MRPSGKAVPVVKSIHVELEECVRRLNRRLQEIAGSREDLRILPGLIGGPRPRLKESIRLGLYCVQWDGMLFPWQVEFRSGAGRIRSCPVDVKDLDTPESLRVWKRLSEEIISRNLAEEDLKKFAALSRAQNAVKSIPRRRRVVAKLEYQLQLKKEVR